MKMIGVFHFHNPSIVDQIYNIFNLSNYKKQTFNISIATIKLIQTPRNLNFLALITNNLSFFSDSFFGFFGLQQNNGITLRTSILINLLKQEFKGKKSLIDVRK